MRFSITRDKLWLCLPIIVAELLDYSVTMLGQPAEYWKGSYHLVNEFNPFARWFMVIHPLGAILYIVLDIAATYDLPFAIDALKGVGGILDNRLCKSSLQLVSGSPSNGMVDLQSCTPGSDNHTSLCF
jgi:hypothetical protein